MSWKDKLVPASFRGVPFNVDSSEFQTGRRGIQHEYVNRDKPFTEDTGRVGKKYNVEAYIVGKEYFTTRDALITALEKEGSGELVHPYYGRLQVQAFSVSVKETVKDGGICTFSIGFVEAGDSAFPLASIDNRQTLLDKAGALLDKANDAFTKVFQVANSPQFVVDSATAKVTFLTDKIAKITTGAAVASQNAALTQRKIANLNAQVAGLVQSPVTIANAMADVFTSLASTLTNPRGKYTALASLFTYGATDSVATAITANRIQEQANNFAFNAFIIQTSVAQAAMGAIDIPYTSTVDAASIRQGLLDVLDGQLLSVSDDDLFQSIQDLKAEVIQAIPPADQSLPTIGQITLLQTAPSLVVVYDQYENPIYEDDFLSRNKISHPGFVPGGRVLEVLQIG